MAIKYVKPEKISLKNQGELNEKWVQEIIAQDPTILNLGELVLKDKERIQPHAGRLRQQPEPSGISAMRKASDVPLAESQK